MTESEAAPIAAKSRIIRPTDEFRRWLLVAVSASMAVAMAECIVATNTFFEWDHLVVFSAIVWFCISAPEAWVQFPGKVARLGWVLAGVLAGVCVAHIQIFYLEGDVEGYPWRAFAFLLIPGVVECVTARRSRRRAWVWLVATPLIYGSVHWWAIRLSSGIYEHFFLLVRSALALPASGAWERIPYIASFYGALLLTRAVVGSFIASRKDPCSLPIMRKAS
jgi:hypothetical protein